MAFWKQNGWKLTVAAAVLALAGGWAWAWQRIGRSVDRAAEDQIYRGFVCRGAYYARCSEKALAAYTAETSPGEAARGEAVGTVQLQTPAGTLEKTAYVCTLAAYSGEYPPLLMLERDGSFPVYELTGFQSLDGSPSAAAVCSAYGIGGADDLAAVTVTETDGTVIGEMTGQADLAEFYRKLAALGEDLGEAGTAQAYYDVFIEKYGDAAGVSLKDGKIEFSGEEAEKKANALWAEGVCLVTVRLKNGLQLRELVYSPVPAVFAVYGSYRLTEPFFR